MQYIETESIDKRVRAIIDKKCLPKLKSKKKKEKKAPARSKEKAKS